LASEARAAERNTRRTFAEESDDIASRSEDSFIGRPALKIWAKRSEPGGFPDLIAQSTQPIDIVDMVEPFANAALGLDSGRPSLARDAVVKSQVYKITTGAPLLSQSVRAETGSDHLSWFCPMAT
jgi:hypothetical protein